jgi:hypothetical protein
MAATLGEMLPQLIQQLLGVPQAAAAGPGGGPGAGPGAGSGAGSAFQPDDISELLQSLQFGGPARGAAATAGAGAPPAASGGLLEHLQKVLGPMAPGTTSVARQGPAAPPLRRMPGTGSDYVASPPAAPPVAPGTAGPMLPEGAGSAPAGGGLMERLQAVLQGVLGGGQPGLDVNDRPAVDLSRAPATGAVRTDATGRALMPGPPAGPTDFAAGNEANERPGVSGGMLTELRNAMSSAMEGPADAPANIDGMDQRPARQVYEGGRLQPNVAPFGRPRTTVATDQDAPLAENIMRGAEQSQAAQDAAKPWSSGNVGNTLLGILSNTLKAMPSDGKSQWGAGFGGAGEVLRRGDTDKALKVREARANRAETRADRADTRAERADTRAEETHKLNVTKLADEIKRRMGGQLTPEQMLRVDQIAATLFRSSRSGAVRQATDKEVIEAFNKYRENIVGRYTQPSGGLPGPVGGLPAPGGGAAAPAQGGPRAAAPAPSAASGAARGAGVPVGGTYTAADGKVYKRIGPGNTQADWQIAQ